MCGILICNTYQRKRKWEIFTFTVGLIAAAYDLLTDYLYYTSLSSTQRASLAGHAYLIVLVGSGIIRAIGTLYVGTLIGIEI